MQAHWRNSLYTLHGIKAHEVAGKGADLKNIEDIEEKLYKL